MYLQQLKNISHKKGLNQADVARLAGVSRAAVSKWFHQAKQRVNMETKTLLQLSRGLGVAPEDLLKECPNLAPFQTEFLWDHLYLTMEDFVQALIQGQRPALARLVQVLGFHASSQVLGKRIISSFEKYKKYIKPARRRELEVLWPLYAS